MKSIFTLLTLSISFSIYALPSYYAPELIIQSSMNDGYRLPPTTLFTNATASINDHREMAMSLAIINGTNRSGIWTKTRYSSGISYARTNTDYIANIKLNNDANFVFLVKNQFETLGLFKATGNEFGYSIDDLTQKFKLKSLSRFSSAHLTNDESVIFKASDEQSNKGIYLLKEKLIKVDSENTQTALSNSYIFTPATSLEGNIAYKVRLGKTRQWGESQPDKIILYKNGVKTIVAEDTDSNPSSRWVSFFNNVSVNDSGDVAFYGKNRNGKFELILYKDKQYYIYATEDKQIKEFAQFSPTLNNKGMIAFRAKDHEGRHSVYISEYKSIKKLLSQGESMEFEIGVRTAYYGKYVPFGGNLGLNNLGDVTVNVSLSDVNKEKDLGKGIIVFYSK